MREREREKESERERERERKGLWMVVGAGEGAEGNKKEGVKNADEREGGERWSRNCTKYVNPAGQQAQCV